MLFSLIVCTYNRRKYIYNTLRAIAQCDFPKDDYELIVINNNSTDGTAEDIDSFQKNFADKVNLHCLTETRQGLSFARNRGIEDSCGDWIVFIDDDAFVFPDYLRNLASHISQIPDMSAFGGKIHPAYEGEEPRWVGRWSRSWVSALDLGDSVKPFQGNAYPIGANMGIRRDALQTVGSFNTDLGRKGDSLLGGEEKDIFLRMKARNMRVYYLPDVEVTHNIPPHRTTRDFIARLGKGVGISERNRTKNISNATFVSRVFTEIVRWAGTLALWCAYLFKGQREKGDVLVLFRRKVTSGLLCGQ